MRPTTGVRVNSVWLFLSLVTVASWLLASQRGQHEFSPSTAVTVTVVVMAAVKVRFIITQFMETRVGPAWLRRLTGGWLTVLAAAILVLYLV